MGDQRYEYLVKEIAIYPSEIQEERFDEFLNETASDGWELTETVVLDASTTLFIFKRPV